MSNYFKKPSGNCVLQKPVYYTSLFQNVGIGEFYLKDYLGVIGAVGNELLSQRVKWAKELYPDCEIVCGDITDPKVFDELVRLHKEKGCTGVKSLLLFHYHKSHFGNPDKESLCFRLRPKYEG